MNKTKRNLNVALETRDNEEDKMIIEGYPIIFNSPATHYYTEIISDSALDNCDMSDVVLRYNHLEDYQVMARTRNKSLKLEKDNKGLKMVTELLDTQSNRDIYKAIKAGLIDKMSFAFTVRSDEYDYDTDTRTITDIDKLYDVAVVDQPFYDSTSVYARDEDNDDFIQRREELRKEHEDSIKQEEELKTAKEELEKELNN